MTTTHTDAFHAHLDVCEQCREHPFELCPVGGPLFCRAFEEAAHNLDFRGTTTLSAWQKEKGAERP